MNQIAKNIYRYRKEKGLTQEKLLDIGCGEGRNAVFFARNGYDVTAFDISDAGIEKTKRLADHVGVEVNVFKADLLDFRYTIYKRNNFINR
ncbi:class I SAM-dependent methyltransferase [Thermoactinomyces sp. DSM 45891]|uniref:class I SAM-dependent methyltransferase n=1 Tax=Thermoactinomyces sp. DSM 45891 TaxID=1761907 RepID=UPI0025704D0E|nr:class I SAM-dependent methyltransferase [Thermoactinomyces sp. DSM 45891]